MLRQTLTQVVAGILRTPEGILLAQRPENKQHAGLWEYPGGKVEQGESQFEALKREWHEELGMLVESATHFYTLSNAEIELNVWSIQAYRGQAEGREGQAIQYSSVQALKNLPMPGLDDRITHALTLPESLAITAPNWQSFSKFKHCLNASIQQGIRHVLFRPVNPQKDLEDWGNYAYEKLDEVGGQLILHEKSGLKQTAAHGIHISQASLMEQKLFRTDLPCSASCHDEHSLNQAEKMGCQFALLSPVKPTHSHPELTGLGWRAFSALSQTVNIPVLALGGLQCSDLSQAKLHHGLGVAGIRGFWPVF